MDLNEKVALVTGAANGIGMATVQQLLKNGLKGVSMCDIDSKNGERAALSFAKQYGKDRIIFIRTDVTKEKDLEEAFNKTKGTFGTIDIVINNAGVIGEDKWETEIEVNVFPPMDMRHGVRILCMCPGATDTPIVTGIYDAYGKLDIGRDDVFPGRTVQQPDDVAQGIVHILREGATGSVWVSDNCRPAYQVEFPNLLKQPA